MSDDPPSADAEPPPIPRWVKVFVLVVVLLVLLVVVLGLAGVGGDHGPGSHALGITTWSVPSVFGHGRGCPEPTGDGPVGDVVPPTGGHR